MARAIDSEKYMELLKEQYLHYKAMKHGEAARAWQGAIQLLYDMPTLTPPNDWISVEDRLPENSVDGEAVLAVVSGKPHENIKLIGALMIAEYFAGEGWLVNEYPEWEEPTVTHWMPLPQPPKEAQP